MTVDLESRLFLNGVFYSHGEERFKKSIFKKKRENMNLFKENIPLVRPWKFQRATASLL